MREGTNQVAISKKFELIDFYTFKNTKIETNDEINELVNWCVIVN